MLTYMFNKHTFELKCKSKRGFGMVKRSSLLYPDEKKRFEALTGDETEIQENT